MELKKNNYFLHTIFLCGILTAVKVLSLYYININLWVDEAQYWAWSKELAYGYYSKPPLIAWIIHFTTGQFGDNEFGIRAASPIIHFITAIFIYGLAKHFYDRRTGLVAALIYITLPAVTLSSGFISTDAPLLLFWAGALYFMVSATRNPSIMNWLGYAVFLGFGLLSKYTAGAFIIMSFVYIFTNRRGKEFFKLDFWIANFFAFLIFLPNLIWNYDNHFVSFLHTSENVVTGGSSGGIKIGDMLEFTASQLIVFGPALVFFIIALLRARTLNIHKDTLLLFSLPLLFIGIIISLFSGAQAHWAAPAYVAATVFTAGFLVSNNNNKALKIILITNIIIFVLCLNIRIPAGIASIKKDPLHRVNMWYQPKDIINELLLKNPDALIVSNERKIIAPLMFALRDSEGNPETIYKWNPGNQVKDHFDLTKTFTDTSERPVIFISRGDSTEMLSDIYFNVETIRSPDESFNFYLYLLKGRRDKN